MIISGKLSAYFLSAALAAACCVSSAVAQPSLQPASQLMEPVLALAKKEQPAMLQTMKALVEIESGSACTSPRA